MIHRVDDASDGIRQSPRGERLMLPTLGPSGIHERLNCWLKKRRQNVFSQCFIVSLSYTPANALHASIYILRGWKPWRIMLYMKKSCSLYGPTRSSVFCLISPWEEAGISSGLMGVSITSQRASCRAGSSVLSANHCTRCFTSVLGTEALTPYMDIWSPL